jgi:O-methyltransferase
VTLHQGRCEDTVRPAGPIAIAHVDCEWHDPVAVALERLEPCLRTGAMAIVDDYFAYAGVRAATDAFLRAHPAFQVVRSPEHVVIRRTA